MNPLVSKPVLSFYITFIYCFCKRCSLYCRSKDEDLDLVSVDEFYSQAPEEISRPVCMTTVMLYLSTFFTECLQEVTKTDEHEQRKARLQWELAQRMT